MRHDQVPADRFTTVAYPNGVIPDHQLIRDAQALLDLAKLWDAPNACVPRWLLEQLIEKAQRPHD